MGSLWNQRGMRNSILNRRRGRGKAARGRTWCAAAWRGHREWQEMKLDREGCPRVPGRRMEGNPEPFRALCKGRAPPDLCCPVVPTQVHGVCTHHTRIIGAR